LSFVNFEKFFFVKDEVESLTAARKSSSQEPSDAIRVVNAVLTQLDSIKNHNNVLIMATSNITGAIGNESLLLILCLSAFPLPLFLHKNKQTDMAFIDRADIKQYIGLPSTEGIVPYFNCVLLSILLSLFHQIKQRDIKSLEVVLEN
jgi:SpoVK/Ycf46/Vps4 family AAA+-type ATPase